MDTQVKPAYYDLLVASHQLIDPRSLSRRKGGLNHRLGRTGIVGVGVGCHLRRLGRAGVRGS
jgi:hypothetical protein